MSWRQSCSIIHLGNIYFWLDIYTVGIIPTWLFATLGDKLWMMGNFKMPASFVHYPLPLHSWPLLNHPPPFRPPSFLRLLSLRWMGRSAPCFPSRFWLWLTSCCSKITPIKTQLPSAAIMDSGTHSFEIYVESNLWGQDGSTFPPLSHTALCTDLNAPDSLCEYKFNLADLFRRVNLYFIDKYPRIARVALAQRPPIFLKTLFYVVFIYSLLWLE